MTTKILVVDDEPEIRRLLRTCFEREGYAVAEAADAAATRAALNEGIVSLVTLDLALGQEDGLSLAREIRAKHDVPIVMVSGKGDTVDRIVGLEIGADDYISKPFNLREVLARVRSVLRRHDGGNRAAATTSSPAHEIYEFGGWSLDATSRELKDEKGVSRELTTAEFNLLEMFARRPHRALTRDEIMDILKGHDYSPLDRSIDALVSRVRRKIDNGSNASPKIKSIRGIGYMFTCDVRRRKA
ncbi:Transcriptional regulatory protein AruR [Hyphomicrobium sp. GJ21]|uniref:response regulator n=1 Tax=Hyphomicrobium sp. GJ21 TaxID=113574 RepID=UPI000622B56C|nr:response regulator [Hyphomicrobium sp. GJ21]CEJ86519.1 Transcriptional regulatory protein AruR [Hyphomicrobium sp. GJ21]